MLIPDPGSRIRIFSIPDTRSWIQIFPTRNPDPQSKFFPSPVTGSPRNRIKEFKYLNPKKMVSQPSELWSSFPSRIQILTFYPSWIPILGPGTRIHGVKKAHLGSLIRDQDSQHCTGHFRFALAVGGSVGYWLSRGAAVLATHSIYQLLAAFMCKKEFFV